MQDNNSGLLVITGASGRQNSHLIPHLYGKRTLRLVVNSSSSKEHLESIFPKAQIVQADLCQPDDARSILCGASAIWHVGPPFHAHETEIAYNLIDAAVEESKKGTFEHFILSSVLNSQLRKLMNHDCKRLEEEYLLESGLAYTILQPSHFMDNFPLKMLSEQKQPTYKANWDPKIAFSFAALKDVGEAAAKVINEGSKHFFAQYPLCSTGPKSYEEVVATASGLLGKQIRIERKPFEEAVDSFVQMVYGDAANARNRDGAERLLLYYNRRGLVGNPNVLEWLIGRRATSLQEWMQSQLGDTEQ